MSELTFFTSVEIDILFYSFPCHRRTRSGCKFICLRYCTHSSDYKTTFRSYSASKQRSSSQAGRIYCFQFQSLLYLHCTRYICNILNTSHQHSINLQTPNVNYSGRTASLASKVAFYIFIQQIQVLNILNMVYTLRFFSSKCSLFHNSNEFGSCIIHILYTGCAKIKKIIPAPKG